MAEPADTLLASAGAWEPDTGPSAAVAGGELTRLILRSRRSGLQREHGADTSGSGESPADFVATLSAEERDILRDAFDAELARRAAEEAGLGSAALAPAP